MLFNDRRATKRALNAAQGPSLAPAGYEPDSLSRKNVRMFSSEDRTSALKRGHFMSKKEGMARGVARQEFYEKNPIELKARNRYEVEKGEKQTKISIPKNKKKGN